MQSRYTKMTHERSAPTELPIDTLLRYHIKENHLPDGYTVFRKEAILLFLGLGGLNYVFVAYQNGSTFAIKVIDAVTTAILGLEVLYISGLIYYNIKIQPQYVDSALEEIIQAPLTKEKFFREMIGQSILATASAVPLATTLFDTDLEIFKDHPWLFWLTFSFILAVNAAMHLVPIELTQRDKFYGLLFHQLTRLSRWITCYQLSAAEAERAERLAERAVILDAINPVLNNAKENFLHVLACENDYEIQARLQRYQNLPDALLKEMLACYIATPALNPGAKKAARILGGGFVSVACLGYAVNPYLVFRNDFSFSIEGAVAITAMPIYFFMVLMTFFGDGMGVRVLENMLSLRDVAFRRASIQEKLPTAAKLYPEAFAFLMLGVAVIMAFAGAPGREMMQIAFAEIFPAWLMIIMMGVVDIGIGMLLGGFVAFDFAMIMLNHYAQYQGADFEKNIVIINAKIEALLRDFKRINPEFAATLKTYIILNTPCVDPVQNNESFIQSQLSSCCACLYSKPDDLDADQRVPLLGGEGGRRSSL